MAGRATSQVRRATSQVRSVCSWMTRGGRMTFRSSQQTVAAAPAGAVKRGGQLNVVIQNDWVTLDPLFNSAEPNGTNMIYGEWVRWDKDDKGQWGPQPEMVAEWDLKPDVVTLKLQKGVTFHDGTPWDAKAAKWNLDRMIFDPTSRMKAYWAT